MKKLFSICTMLAVVAFAAYAGTKEAVNLSNTLGTVDKAVVSDVSTQIAELMVQLDALRANGGDQTDVRAQIDALRGKSEAGRNEDGSLDLACADCAPAHADLGFIGNVVYAYFAGGNLGTDGKWVARFDGVAGSVYHWDLCPTAPGTGTNAGFGTNDIDIRIKSAACVQLAYIDGLSSCVPAWSPNDFTWACPANGTYFIEIKDYSSGASACNGTVDMTFELNYYADLPPATPYKCCYGDPCHPQCQDLLQGECIAIGGTWFDGLRCASSPCEIPALPGELCCNSIPVPGVPFSGAGNTCAYANNYDAVCPYTGSTSPDVAYSYTPAVDQVVTLSLCLSGYDTKLYVYDGAPVAGSEIACNDDAIDGICPGATGSYRSLIECLPLFAGHTYCIIVDGYGGACGDYVLTMEECIPDPPCDVVCPPNARPEGEEPCFDGYVDIFNAGCNTPVGVPLSFSPIACGDLVCGTYGQFLGSDGSGQRDTDWYLLTVASDNDSVLICVTGEAVTQLVVMPVVDCGLLAPLYNLNSEPCIEQCFLGCLPAGDYWVFVSTGAPAPCGSEYLLSVSCQPCSEPFVCHCGEGANSHCQYAIDNTTYPIDSAIPTTCVTINVPIEYQITDLDVCLDIVHTYDGDIVLTLTSPLGTVIDLSSNNGGSGDNYTCTTFDDEAASPVITGTAPFSNSYQPETPLSAVDGENALGAWVLCITDVAGGDEGWLNYVCLTFTYDIILPVAFGSFDAVAGNEEVTLNWNTLSETNVGRFEVYRDGAKVTEIAATNNATGSTYSYTDENLTNGTVYSYSLVSFDVNGARQDLATINATPNFGAATVSEYALHQNYPNPFNPTTNIAFDMVEAGNVTISVFNLLGQKVAELVNDRMEAGRHVVAFDATSMSSGLYLYKMEANGFSMQQKMILMK